MLNKIGSALRDIWRALAKRSVLIPIVGAATVLCMALSFTAVNTYIVHDGEQVSVHNSFTGSVARALEEMDITLGELDAVETPDEPINGVAEIRINRAFNVNISADGKTQTLRVGKYEPVNQILKRAGITLGAQDILSHASDSFAQEGDTISVTRYVSYKVEELVNIPYTKETRKTEKLDQGTTKVVQQGKNGQKKQTYQVILRDGQETRTLISEETVKEATSHIVQVGTRATTTGAGTIAVSRGGAPVRYKKAITVTATAYTTERQRHKRTATGAVARVGLIAVDPRVIPLGSRLYITSADGKSWVYGTAVAADTGGAIKGNRIDLFFNTHRECVNFGRRKAIVYVLE